MINENGNICKLKKYFPLLAVNMIAGIFTYSLLITNQLVNQFDGLWHGSVSYANGHELSIGRWFWRFLDRGRFYLSPDPVTSVISLLFFILGFILILDIFDVKSRPAALLSSLAFTVNTSILVLLSYRYMSPTFAISYFLCVLTAYILIKARKKAVIYIIPPVCISLAMGLYQAYIGCTCLVILLYISLCLYKGEKTLKETGLFTVRCIISTAIGMVLYYILLYINLWHYDVTLDSYNGANSYGPVGMLLHLPASIIHAYSDFSGYYRQVLAHSNIFNGKIYMAVYILLAIYLIYATVTLFKESIIRAILFVFTLLLIPLAANAVLLVTFDSITSIQMTLPMSMCLSLLLCLASSVKEPQISILKAYKAVLALALCLLIYGNYIMTIYDQQAMYMGRQSLTEISREVITTLQKNNLYHPDYQYVFAGSPANSPLFAMNDVYKVANDYARIGTWSADDTVSAVQCWQGFFTYEMGINMRIADSERLQETLEDPAVNNMPVFPEEGCCALVNDVVVVKLSDRSEWSF